MLTKGEMHVTKVTPEVNGLLHSLPGLGKVSQGSERLLEVADSFPIGRAVRCPCPGLAQVASCPVPELAAEGMEMEKFERFVMLEIQRGQPVIGTYPPSAEARTRYEEWAKKNK